ncbi:hypothetical protein TrVFT333_003792 [Trichoderma virens FT-333]|nr:hypothetical protein TrVFT333_003792 [Trichoderma virens FT-333]
MMASPLKKQPQDVADCVLKRAEVSKIARRLQNRLALAQFKTKHGWEDLTLDLIEPKVEEEIRRKRLYEGDVLSDSSSSASDLPYPTKTLMSSPLKAPLFSDAVGSSNGSSGHRKRTYFASFDNNASSPTKRFRGSPTTHKSFGGHALWKDGHQLTHSSPMKPRRQQHFTTSAGPDVSFFQQRRMTNELNAHPNFTAPDEDDDDLLPAHSFAANIRSSPPRTPPMQSRTLRKRGDGAQGGQEGADLLLKLDLPSAMMTTPGGGNPFPNTPGQGFDFADFVNITPSPAQKVWKTPNPLTGARTPRSVARKRLTFDEPRP